MFPDKVSNSLVGNNRKEKRTRVALIGCGAAGMCFLNALITRKKRGDDVDGVLPYITCFEQASEPGGCWRHVPKDTQNQSQNLACWYDEVWSNIAKECFEFPDYTYKQHFGHSVPAFLPRKDLLEYFKQRTLINDRTLLDEGKHELHEIRFSTIVTNVSFDDTLNVFTVATASFDPNADKRHKYEATLVEEFDYCIWAAGIRGKPRIPRSLLTLLRSGICLVDENINDTPFTGIILHSMHALSPEKLIPAVNGKRVVLIGDSDSAVDLSLHALKIGASKVMVLSRSGYGDCCYMGSWPCRKNPETQKMEPIVEVHVALPFRVVENGKSIECGPVVWNHEEGVYQVDESEDTIVVKNVDTVIFCTGYVPNTDFMSESLRVNAEDLFSLCWTAPEKFTMRENPLTPDVGQVVPSRDLGFSGNLIPGMYRSVLISNPKMMYIMDINSEYPLLHLESEAWMCLAFCVGDMNFPALEVVEEEMQKQMLEEMNIAYLRWSIDPNYFEALDELDDDHWTDDYTDSRTIQMNEEYLGYYVRLIARNLKESKYPINFGTYGDLNDLGKKLVKLGLENIKLRHLLDPSNEETEWKTFRDANPKGLSSIYTGETPSPLPKPWLLLKSDDNIIDISNAGS
mmetsp:Transcript_29366/g.44815  ORF Transcript_29366/g.44815 Transcript_29366/m.44815 type:complete len:628 (-) Transcript_29366:258-2141(-)|eukprot:CAMPEP_0194223714 /NCGR_PEP_ID=MMETSP0156-20130528/35754_1 /TAXON_ID=33649 /ORGANISM="Thalassionema nitzschioides, Strain L26-B" /LENGTH=627 /DNA_ID=CAMNT_0038954953 /DNA_START=53 /DNA_END=1936 /DNA_ORIENTATION=+